MFILLLFESVNAVVCYCQSTETICLNYPTDCAYSAENGCKQVSSTCSSSHTTKSPCDADSNCAWIEPLSSLGQGYCTTFDSCMCSTAVSYTHQQLNFTFEETLNSASYTQKYALSSFGIETALKAIIP